MAYFSVVLTAIIAIMIVFLTSIGMLMSIASIFL